MPKPITLNLALRILKENGVFFISQRGSHGKFRKTDNGTTRTVIVKMTKKEIPYGTFQSILLLSGLKESDFRDK